MPAPASKLWGREIVPGDVADRVMIRFKWNGKHAVGKALKIGELN